MRTIPEVLTFVDFETTGGNPDKDRILEIGIWRTENGNLVDQLVTVIDPDSYIPREIMEMTGISEEEIEKAPTFRDVADQVFELLDGSIFIAHNARFDYAFIKSEFKRLGISWSINTLCTVKLFRKLRPDLKRHNLDALIEEYELECTNRHRAGDDAKVLLDFFNIGEKLHGEGFWDSAKSLLKRPSWPIKLADVVPESFPETSGVYLFKDDDGYPIYIGKSTNIKERIISHFLSDDNPKELKISQAVAAIDYICTPGEMSALILESELIKKHLPIFNRMLRRGQKMIGIFTTTESEYMGVILKVIDDLKPEEIEHLVTITKSKKRALEILEEIAEEYRICPKMLGITSEKGACFWRQIEKCDGACEGSEPAWKHNAKLVAALSKIRVKRWPFNGPILVHEQDDQLLSKWEIDRWCIRKYTFQDSEGNVNENIFNPVFDWDTYKILRKFILSNGISIQQI